MTVPKDFRYRYHRRVPSPPARTRVAVADGVGGDPDAVAQVLAGVRSGCHRTPPGLGPEGQLLPGLERTPTWPP